MAPCDSSDAAWDRFVCIGVPFPLVQEIARCSGGVRPNLSPKLDIQVLACDIRIARDGNPPREEQQAAKWRNGTELAAARQGHRVQATREKQDAAEEEPGRDDAAGGGWRWSNRVCGSITEYAAQPTLLRLAGPEAVPLNQSVEVLPRHTNRVGGPRKVPAVFPQLHGYITPLELIQYHV